VGRRFSPESGTAVDPTGRISVRLPEGWQAQPGRWSGPALLISPDPARWRTDDSVRGAFLWFARDGGSPDGFVARIPHADCAPEPVRHRRLAGIDWVIAAYLCPGRRGPLVEAAATGLVYVQIAPPANNPSTFVDTLLAGVRVRPN
jgi:hypothetical protein